MLPPEKLFELNNCPRVAKTQVWKVNDNLKKKTSQRFNCREPPRWPKLQLTLFVCCLIVIVVQISKYVDVFWHEMKYPPCLGEAWLWCWFWGPSSRQRQSSHTPRRAPHGGSPWHGSLDEVSHAKVSFFPIASSKPCLALRRWEPGSLKPFYLSSFHFTVAAGLTLNKDGRLRTYTYKLWLF